jgi:membrane-anchored glycerophosphoryl diester phosphodiesterase (GDPDase)
MQALRKRKDRHMATIAKRDISIGTIISATIETVRGNARPVLYFVGLFTVVGTIADYAAASGNVTSEFISGLWQVSIVIASVVAMYFLLEAMLRQSALMSHSGPRRILPYVGQAIAIGFGVVFGLILLIVPGLILAARWSLAQPLLVGQGMGVFDSMRRSWELTRGHTLAIIIAAIALFALAFIGIVVIYAVFGEEAPAALFMGQVLENGISAVSLAFTVALLDLLEDGTGRMEEVFA